MELILFWIKEYCSCVGVDLLGAYEIQGTEYVLMVLNDCYVGTDVTEIVYKGMEQIFKEHGVKMEV